MSFCKPQDNSVMGCNWCRRIFKPNISTHAQMNEQSIAIKFYTQKFAAAAYVKYAAAFDLMDNFTTCCNLRCQAHLL
jgi:hypothetical protein